MLSRFVLAITAASVFAAMWPAAMWPASAQESTGQAPARVAPRAAGPEALVEKSVRDLSRGDVGGAVGADIKALRRGPLLMHGNYCGIGNRPGAVPIDALDAACMRHDACTRTGHLPGCACNDRLRLEAAAIAQDRRAAPDEQVAAAATASAMSVLVCKSGGRLEVPILPAPR